MYKISFCEAGGGQTTPKLSGHDSFFRGQPKKHDFSLNIILMRAERPCCSERPEYPFRIT
jgi:hypothetical protein